MWNSILPQNEKGMLVRKRKSHILWKEKLIEYPIKLSVETIKNIGLYTAVKSLTGYLLSCKSKERINTLEDFYVRRFGKELYSIFFKDYTEKLWGMPAKELSHDWGAQRIQKISIRQIVASLIPFCGKRTGKERSLISEYLYPAFGCGQLWTALADRLVESGGELRLNSDVKRIKIDNVKKCCCVTYKSRSVESTENFDYVISSMPLAELISSVDNVPDRLNNIAARLHYRDMAVIGINVHKKHVGALLAAADKDNWLYIQDKKIPFGRIQILNNWSPYAANAKDSVLLELEFFCNKNDDLWNTDDNELLARSLNELENCHILKDNSSAESFTVQRVEKAYPIYNDGYYQLSDIEAWVNKTDVLRCIGRNGQHRYNNMDHSVETGLFAARSIMEKNYDKRQLWNVNRGKKYIEEKQI